MEDGGIKNKVKYEEKEGEPVRRRKEVQKRRKNWKRKRGWEVVKVVAIVVFFTAEGGNVYAPSGIVLFFPVCGDSIHKTSTYFVLLRITVVLSFHNPSRCLYPCLLRFHVS